MRRLAMMLCLLVGGCAGLGPSPTSFGPGPECGTGDVTLYVVNEDGRDVRIRVGAWSPLRSALGLKTTEYVIPRGYVNTAAGIGATVVRGGRYASDATSMPMVSCNEMTLKVTSGIKLFAFGADVRMRRADR